MNKISDRRKLMHGSSIVSQDQDPGLFRANTTVTIANSTPPSIDELKKIVIELEKSLKNQKDLRIEAEQNCKLHQIRTMMRQRQFHKILQESDKKIRSYVKQNEASSVVRQIKKSYQEILLNFQSTNQATNTIIENKYKENMLAMERRIEKIMMYMNEQLMKTKMMSSASVNEIRRQIEQALTLAKKIELQNAELQLAIKKEFHKNKLLEEERKLLLDEVVNKKFVINKLVDDNRILKKKVEQLQLNSAKPQSSSANKYQQSQPNIPKDREHKLKTLGNSYVQFQTKQTITEKTKQPVFFGNPENLKEKEQLNLMSGKLDKSRFSASSDKSSPKELLNRISQGSKIFNKSYIEKNLAHKGSQINYRKLERKYTKKSMGNKSKIFEDGYSGYMVTLTKNDTICAESPEKAQNQRIVQHLKKCLQRQKRRVAELSKIVTKIQNRNEEVNEAIFQMITAAREKNLEEGGSSYLLKCQQLLKLISDMKKRLAMCQSPSMQCGWGDIEVEKLIQQSGTP